ncbi:DMT family transporter [Alkalibacillus almallahensis]|uniref:DMT family transporter n=1 Tax=Alkalibacillus almallahensis TaxID=1379154 RepID=UPI0014218F53|nr:DMT family transporter [Alkalibacillus almallahensis]NIK11510.1 drug/metabolite transporter (DMT)-like permease [Alkalibacillus almallahensis]
MRFAGVGLVMLAAICWGITGGIADILMSKGWSPLVISFYRGAIGVVFFVIWLMFYFRRKWFISRRFFIWSFLAGIGVAGNFTFYFLSIQSSSIAVGATLMYTAPIFVLLISFVLKLERSTWFKWGCIASVLVGIALLTGAYNPSAISVSLIGVLAGLASGISYAVFIFGFKNAASLGKSPMTLTFAFLSFCFVLFFFIDLEEAANVATSSDIGWFLLLGVLGAGVSFIIYLVGLRMTAPTTASMVAMLEPVTASLFGVLLLGDHLGLIQLLGMMLILVTVMLLSVKQSD